MLTDDEGYLWVETHEEREQGEKTATAYDLYDKDGLYDAKIWLEISPKLIHKGKLYSMYTDDEFPVDDIEIIEPWCLFWNVDPLR